MNRLACVAFLLLPLAASGFAPSRIGRVSSPIRAAATDDDKVEKAWRHVKKPLLRIGGKGVSKTHGNSLRQLLKDHTAVKVKINTDKYGACVRSTSCTFCLCRCCSSRLISFRVT